MNTETKNKIMECLLQGKAIELHEFLDIALPQVQGACDSCHKVAHEFLELAQGRPAEVDKLNAQYSRYVASWATTLFSVSSRHLAEENSAINSTEGLQGDGV